MIISDFQTNLSDQPLDIVRLQAGFLNAFGHCGAMTTFVGIVRQQRDDQIVQFLELDWYPGLSERSLESVARDTVQRFSVAGLTVVHRCGKVMAGEPIVFVGAAGSHRRETFDAVDYTMDRLKSDIALWKREVGPDLDHWVEPTHDDSNDLRRWG